MSANAAFPAPRALDLYLDGLNWKLDLWSLDGSAQIAASTATKVGAVDVAVGGIVTLPLDLRALGGNAAKEIRGFGAGSVKLLPSVPASADFPVSSHTLVSGEVVSEQIEQIISVSGLTRLRISWGS